MATRIGFGRFAETAVSSHDQVTRTLGTEILAGVYHPGAKLPSEAELLARFGVSRTVLREAFKTLTAKGLIMSKTRVGTTVLDSSNWNFFDADVLAWKVAGGFDVDFVHDLAAVRLAIEPAAAVAAARNATSADIALMRHCIVRMAAATSDPGDFAVADLEFHKAVGRASGNVLMRSVSAVIETALLASFRLSSPAREAEAHAESVQGHSRIIDAIEAHDTEAAAEAMRAIIGHGVRRIERAQEPRAAGEGAAGGEGAAKADAKAGANADRMRVAE